MSSVISMLIFDIWICTIKDLNRIGIWGILFSKQSLMVKEIIVSILTGFFVVDILENLE